jgi:hypothetical protein
MFRGLILFSLDTKVNFEKLETKASLSVFILK